MLVKRMAAMALVWAGMSGGLESLRASGAESTTVQIIQIVVHERYFRVNPPKLQPGAARLLIENRTALQDPTVTFQLMDGAGKSSGKALAPDKAKEHTRWQDVTLAPGTYTVSLDQDPSAKATLTVQAGK